MEPLQRSPPVPTPRQSLGARNAQTLLIGDSIISGINPKGLKPGVHKNGIPGGTIDSVMREIRIFDLQHFSNIIIYIGGNDAARGTDIEYFEEKYEQLLSYIKQRNGQCSVHLMNCCPRGDTSTSMTNEVIHRLSEYHHVDVIDTDHAFHDKYGEVINRYYSSDSIHLSQSGIKRLLGTLGKKLQIVQNFEQCTFTKSSRNRQSVPLPRTRISLNKRNGSQHKVSASCTKCGETNHATRQCRHPAQIRCHQCGFYGHKSNRCGSE